MYLWRNFDWPTAGVDVERDSHGHPLKRIIWLIWPLWASVLLSFSMNTFKRLDQWKKPVIVEKYDILVR